MTITVGDIERQIDAAVQDRLRTDPAYKYAECAEHQAEREDEIGREEATRILATHGIALEDWLDLSVTLEVDR